MKVKKCGKSGLNLPAISLGLWKGFIQNCDMDTVKYVFKSAFDSGIVHFDTANNYGKAHGDSEKILGEILRTEFKGARDKITIATKAGMPMWDGIYGQGLSKKHLIASLKQSLYRLHIDYTDIFYLHRYDPETPVMEVAESLRYLLDQGLILYVGISNFPLMALRQFEEAFRNSGISIALVQMQYSLVDRSMDGEYFDFLDKHQIGFAAYSPMGQGTLTNKYIKQKNFTNTRVDEYLHYGNIEAVHQTDFYREFVRYFRRIVNLNNFAGDRGQTLSQLALAWLIANPKVTTVVMGVGSPEHLAENLKCSESHAFTEQEMEAIDRICREV